MTQKFEPQPHTADTGGVGLSANAFADVYADHMPEITRYCRSILRDRDDAEDAAQNAMERALRALAEAPPPERMRPWLFTIAQRESISLLRRRRRATPADLDDGARRPQASPEELAAVRERLAQLLADVRALSPRQREVLVARELGGRSYRQIAQALGTTEAAAQQTVLEARQSLRQFEAGRSLECDQVQAWISCHDHARVRTRRVSAHLRSCTGCRGFQHGIGARRRDFALLLPGLGAGGAGWPTLAALLGQGTAKAITAGAVALTGATLALTVPLQAGHPGPARSATPAATAAPQPATRVAILRATLARRAQIAATPARGGDARPMRRKASVARPVRPAPAAAAASERLPRPESQAAPERTARRPAAAPAPAATVVPPAPVQEPAATPAGDLLQATQPVLDAVAPVTDTVGGVVDQVTAAVPALPELPALPKLP